LHRKSSWKYADLRTPFKTLEINVVAQLFMACIFIIFFIIVIKLL